jgi:hypothetical protein
VIQKGPDLGRLYVDELRQRFHVIPVPHEMRLRIVECSCQDAVNDVDGHGLLADVEGFFGGERQVMLDSRQGVASRSARSSMASSATMASDYRM